MFLKKTCFSDFIPAVPVSNRFKGGLISFICMYNVLSAQFWQSTSSAPTNIERNFLHKRRSGECNMWRIFVQISLGQFPSLLVALRLAALIMNSNSMEMGAEGLMPIPRVLKILPPTLYTKGRERMGLYISNTSNIWNIWYDFNFGGCILRSFVGYSHLDQTSLFNKFISLKALHWDTHNHREG